MTDSSSLRLSLTVVGRALARRLRMLPLWSPVAFGLLTVSVVLVVIGMPQPEKPAAAAPVVLRLSGSSTMVPLLRTLGQQFESAHPEIQVELASGGTNKGIADARSGTVDIGMASRALGGADQDLIAFPIARDGITLVVHNSNPVQMLSRQQVNDLFTGRTTNWRDVGGGPDPVFVVNPGRERGASEFFSHYFGIPYERIRSSQQAGDNPSRLRALIQHPNAITYLSLGEAERSAAAGAPIKLLPVDGVPATARNVRNGSFPIARPLSLVTRNVPTGAAKDFIEFVQSPQATATIREHNFVPYLD